MSLSQRLHKAIETPERPHFPSEPETNGNGGSGPGVNTDPLAPLKIKIHQSLLEALGSKLYDIDLTETELDGRVREKLTQVLARDVTPLSAADRSRVIAEIVDDILGFGPIEPFLRDPTISEVMVNGASNVYVEREGKIVRTDAQFLDNAHLRRTIDKIVARVGRRIDEARPYVDARLPDGSRINAVIPPIAVDGPMLTVRKFSRDPYSVEDLITFGTFSTAASAFLDACVRGRLSILVSGGTGTGKTTTLNVLSSFIPSDQRIVTIEDAAELKLRQPHVGRLEYRPANIEGTGEVSIRDLVRNALRMRPDRIVVGEVRGGEALDMLQAMNTGHDGSISTIHANSPRDALSRLETMVLMAGMDLPMRAVRDQIASAIQIIVHQSRMRDGSRRITHVTEVVAMEDESIVLQDLFTFHHKGGAGSDVGELQPTGLIPKSAEKLRNLAVDVDPEWFLPRRRVSDRI
jgi:pilus assembly protein CpaF